jgi:ABC-type multidrug transport system permease subunit
LAPNPTLAAAYGGLALLILILTSGFAIVRGSIPSYWIWAYYISPVSAVFWSLSLNDPVLKATVDSEWLARTLVLL